MVALPSQMDFGFWVQGDEFPTPAGLCYEHSVAGAALCSATSEASFLGIYWMNFIIFFAAVSLGAMTGIMALLRTCRNSIHAHSVLHQCCTHWEKQLLKHQELFVIN